MKYYLSPKYNHRYLLSYLRKDNPFLDVKLISKEDLLSTIYSLPTDRAIIYLMNKYGFTYEISKLYLTDLVKVNSDSDNPKLHYLYNLKAELQAEGLLINKDREQYRNSEVEIIGYFKEDFELIKILDNLNISYRFSNPIYKRDSRLIKEYSLAEEEIINVLNEIASLIDNGEDIKNIYIFNRNKTYEYYLDKFAKCFNYKLNLINSDTYVNSGAVKLFLKLYKDSHNISESLLNLKLEMQEDEEYLDIETLVNEFTLENVSFDIQYDYFVNKFKNETYKSIRYDKAVNVISNPISVTNKHIFMIGFIQGNYPRISKDIGYLNNKELNGLNRLNSKDNTKLDELSLLSFVCSENFFHFSYSKNSVDGKHFVSPLSSYFDVTIEKGELSDTFYGIEALKLLLPSYKDLDYFYKEKTDNYLKLIDVIDIDYNSFDNKFTHDVKVYDNSSEIKLSTTSLSDYNSCPFSYLINDIIELDKDDDTFNRDRGTLLHSVIENCRKPDFNFDEFYDDAVNKINCNAAQRYNLSKPIKEQLRTAIEAIKKREEGYVSSKIYNEKFFSYSIDALTQVRGKVDSIVTFKDQYYICIDYKSGKTSFDEKKFEYGLSSQLPTYLMLINNDERFKDYVPIGMYINRLITDQLKPTILDNEEFPEYLKLDGKTLGDLNKIDLIDSSYRQGTAKFIKSITILKSGDRLNSRSRIVGEFGFSDYISKVRKQYEEMAANLRNNNFEIAPYFVSERDNGCQYCHLQDICFVKFKDYRVLEKGGNEDEQD